MARLLFQDHVDFSSDGGAIHTDLRPPFPVEPPVDNATAVLEGFRIQFDNRNDHELGRLVVNLTALLSTGTPQQVTVSGDFALRDWSGGDDDEVGDDPFSGSVNYAVFVE